MSAFLTASAASALPALLASVSLSISSPTNYHYVAIPAERAADDAAFEGVGLKEEGGETLLRYEDAAFINEAFAERFNVGTTNGLGVVVVDGSLIPPTNVVLSPATPFRRADVIIEDGWTTNNAPPKVVLEDVDFGIKWSGKRGPVFVPGSGGDGWLSYCPQIVVTNVEAVYRNVKSLSRISPDISYGTTSRKTYSYKSNATYEWTYGGGFQIHAPGDENATTNNAISFVVERTVSRCIHSLQPYQYSSGDDGVAAWHTYGSAFRYEEEDETTTESTMTNTAIKITTQFATPILVKGAYAFLNFEYETRNHPDYANGRKSGGIRYVAKAEVGVEDGTNLVATVKAPLDGSVSANALLEPAFKTMGVRYFASPSALTVEEPELPPDTISKDCLEPHSDEYYGYADFTSILDPAFRLELSGITLVLDVDFNARVLDDGESGE